MLWFSQGKVEVTIAGGKIVWENDELKAVPGSGKYIEMQPFSYLFNGIDKVDAKYLSSLQAPVQRSKAASWITGMILLLWPFSYLY